MSYFSVAPPGTPHGPFLYGYAFSSVADARKFASITTKSLVDAWRVVEESIPMNLEACEGVVFDVWEVSDNDVKLRLVASYVDGVEVARKDLPNVWAAL